MADATARVVDINTARSALPPPATQAVTNVVTPQAVQQVTKVAGVALKWVGIGFAIVAGLGLLGGFVVGRKSGQKSCRLRASNRFFD